MKKMILLTVIILTIGVSALNAAYFLYGDVYNADGTSGTASTENSGAKFTAYRTGINGEFGYQHLIGLYPQQLWPAYSSGGTDYPAYFNTDVGSYDWTTPAANGQEAVAVVETYYGQFGWTGGTFVGAAKQTITDYTTSQLFFSDITMEELPAPQLSSAGGDSITLSWTGLSRDPDNLVTGYTVYRSTEPGGTAGFGPLGAAAVQNKGSTVIYTDAGLSQEESYYYMIAVNYQWGGGNGAPDYYETGARSAAAGPFTITMTPTVTMTLTPEIDPLLASNLQKEKVIIFNNPVRNSRAVIGFYSEGSGAAEVMVYNVKGELIKTFALNARHGANIMERDISKYAPGIYAVLVKVKGAERTGIFPVRKLVKIQ